jgi:hypothetical protein
MEIKIEFYDASYNKLGVTVSPITNISSLLWQRYSMRAYAPENTAWPALSWP